MLSVKKTIEAHKIIPNKKLGQNFILDSSITDHIVIASDITADSTILEIGPGPGGLTSSLLASKAKSIIAIEIDQRCIKALQPLVEKAQGRLKVIQDDALRIEEKSLTSDPIKVIANLPYNIGTKLLFKWLDNLDLFSSFTLMLQKEVVDRIIAKPGNKNYGRTSIIVQWLCNVERIFNIAKEEFWPQPKVDSSVIYIVPRKKPLFLCERTQLERICKIAFMQRRKILRSSLKPVFAENTEKLLIELGIDPTQRAEDLTMEQFCQLANIRDKINN